METHHLLVRRAHALNSSETVERPVALMAEYGTKSFNAPSHHHYCSSPLAHVIAKPIVPIATGAEESSPAPVMNLQYVLILSSHVRESSSTVR